MPRIMNFVCPSCLTRVSPKTVRFIDEAGRVAQGSPPRPLSGFTKQWMSRTSGYDPIDAVRALAEWNTQGFAPFCENGDRLPEESFTQRTIVIGLIGQTGTSKTHYLSVLVHSLLRGALVDNYGLVATIAGEGAAEFRRVYGPLTDRQHFVLELTLPTREGERRKPVMIELRDTRSHIAVNLLFYDPPGEQMMTAQDRARHNKFIYAANALMLFTPPAILEFDFGPKPRLESDFDRARAAGVEGDSLYEPRIRPAGRDVADDRQSIEETLTVFDSIAKEVNKAHGRPATSSTNNLAVSLLLTKFDRITRYYGNNLGITANAEQLARSLEEAQSLISANSTTVANLVQRHEGKGLLATLGSRFPTATFHAVSATGCDADIALGRFLQWEPVSVVTPLFSILAELKVVRSEWGL